MPGSEPGTDFLEALKWLRLAAIHRDGSANRLLIQLSLDGRITPQQNEEAWRCAEDFERAFGRESSKQAARQ